MAATTTAAMLAITLLLCLTANHAVVHCSNSLLYSSDTACSLQLVESIPEGLTYNSSVQHVATFAAYSEVVNKATHSLNFASLYWSLRGTDVMPQGTNLSISGEKLYKMISQAGQRVNTRIAYNNGGMQFNKSDLIELEKLAKVKVVGLDFTALFGDGVLHTKTVSADGINAYIGSSNMDWRSLTQIKELGIMLTNCPTLVADLDKLFETYYLTGIAGRVPSQWPSSVIGDINATHPLISDIGGHRYSIYFGASPAGLCPPQRSRDIDAIIATIHAAKKFVQVAVMDYAAKTRNYVTYTQSFWPEIDNALRDAAYRGVKVQVLASHWHNSDPDVRRFVKSLAALNSSKAFIEGKIFIVPFNEEQAKIPFARVNHNKYLVTESTAVICTSNWEGSYFKNTAGIAMVIKQVANSPLIQMRNYFTTESQLSIVEQVQQLFQRDWSSSYAHYEI